MNLCRSISQSTVILHFNVKISVVVKRGVVMPYCEPLEPVTFVDLIMLALLGNLNM
jgi:hypothetical protein